MKARIVSDHHSYNPEDMEKAHKAIEAKWESLRQDLKSGKYKFDDINSAKRSKFLSEFDSLITDEDGKAWLTKPINEIFNQACVFRGTIIRDNESDPDYNRFIPNAKYIKDDNRFSPKGVDWIYLAVGFPQDKNGLKKAKKCSEKECRAQKGNRFALCEFQAKELDVKIIDLTIGENWNPESQRLEFRKRIKKAKRNNPFDLNPESPINNSIFQKNLIATYAKIMSKQLFVPLTSNDKSLIYAPFHCLASYFKSLGYGGILYQSTVYDKGKNLVLFDKDFVEPVGNINTYII